MTRHDEMLAEVVLRELRGLTARQGVLRLFELGLVSRRGCEQRAIRDEVARLQREGIPRCEALEIVAGKFCCSYEKYLDSKGVDAAYTDAVNGRQGLAYHGIPIVDVRLGSYLGATAFHQSFGMLTDRRNLVLAVNTADMPGNEVRMWYNPDEMENRQRAVFMAGTQILDEALISFAYKQ